MERYKVDFIEFALKVGALKVGADWNLKSGRSSPYFMNVGEFNNGVSLASLGRAYADTVLASGVEVDVVYGIPEKGVALVASTATALAEKEKNVGWFFTRKFPKAHGEFSGLKVEERAKKLIVGYVPEKEEAIAQLDDVFTDGASKNEARELLQSFGLENLPLLAIGVDRQEVGVDGRNAIAEYEAKTGTKVVAIVTANEIYRFLNEAVGIENPNGVITAGAVERVANYLRVYGTELGKKGIGNLEQKIVDAGKSIIPACDLPSLEHFESLVKQTSDQPGIGAYKVGFSLGLRYGLPRVVETARKYTSKPLIYDHQKAATDIPDIGKDFALLNKEAGIDAVILFPQAGSETERAWIYHALNQGLKVIVGGRMTHKAFVVSEGGFITDEGALRIYQIAARAGVNHFVVPGNKPEVIQQIKELVEAEGVDPVFYSPGFVVQGGLIGEAAKVAGKSWHAIVGRGIYEAKDMRAAALEYTSQL